MLILYILLFLITIIAIIFSIKLVQLKSGNEKVTKELENLQFEKISPGSVANLSILPLVDYHTDDPKLKTEAGVSYLINADNTTILMDVGFNKNRENPSPLLHNIRSLAVSVSDIDLIFISHLHLDHVGGMKEQKSGTFSLSYGTIMLPKIPVYSPVKISPSHWNPGPNPEVLKEPKVIANGVANIGPIPRNLFLMGYTLENSLAINVENKGIVLVIGCGHQTIERIIERTTALFDEPIYGIIGGLHFPVKNGRIMLGPLNMQNIVGTHKTPFHGIKENDVEIAIKAIKKVDPQFIAISPHDSSDWSIEQFRTAFKDKFHDLKVGTEMVV